jgi:FixJ family two-component response regulator
MSSSGRRGVVQVCETAEGFLSRPTSDTPSCLVLDINLPGLSNPDVQRRLAAYGQTMPKIFTTGEDDIPLIVRSIKAEPRSIPSSNGFASVRLV